ncbi:MAG: HAD family hydrolase [Lachnospiraceae bacterium]|nr:HAD family hydrolase [Lachnospiraceae bacterium]
MSVKLIGVDLDGTLLTDRKELPAGTRAVLEEALCRGIEIVPITGRPRHGIPEEVLGLKNLHYCISSNGAVTTDLRTGEVLRNASLPVERAAEIVEIVLEKIDDVPEILEIFTGGRGYHNEQAAALIRERFDGTPMMSYYGISRTIVNDVRDLLREPLAQEHGIENIAISTGSREVHEAALNGVKPLSGIKIISYSSGFIEIGSTESDKGAALTALAEHLQIAREETMAFGDNANDIGMLEVAGHPVLMGNAEAHLKERFPHVALDNEHEGVADYIRRHVFPSL